MKADYYLETEQGARVMTKPMASTPMAFKHELHLKGALTGPEDYVEWVNLIRNASPNDMIEFHINSPGGNLYTAVELIGAFAITQATVHVVLSGIVASAGTILMTVGDSFEINPYTTFMFHNYSGGTIGKGNEMATQIGFEREWSRMFMHDIYHGVLSEEEVNDLLDGKDFWLDAEDVGNRLGNMVKCREEIMQKAIDEATAALTEEKPKKKKPAAKKKAPAKKKPAAKKEN